MRPQWQPTRRGVIGMEKEGRIVKSKIRKITQFDAILNARSNAESLRSIGNAVNQVGRGVFKRIDENRELLELLKSRCPEFLEQHFWVEGWLRSQDDFLTAIASASGAHNPRSVSGKESTFPRPWPISSASFKSTEL